MTNREAYFSLTKQSNKYLTTTVIKTVLVSLGKYKDFFDLLKHFDETIEDEEKLNKIIEEIKTGKPYQYVLGEAFFISGNYIVTPDVLIPRQETEQLAIGTLLYISKTFGFDKSIDICDVGTGSGVLAIYLKEQMEKCNMTAIDISQKCLNIAQKNAQNHGVFVDFVLGNVIDPLILKHQKLDVLISNPPYIKDESTIAKETWEYEPHLALIANPPTKYYEYIFKNVPYIMKDKYILAFEIGEDMENQLTLLVEQYLPNVMYKFELDMYNKVRFLYIIKKD